MSDAFWMSFFTFVTFIVGHWMERQRLNRVSDKVDANTNVTVESKRQLYDKVESATKEVTGQAENIAVIANRTAKKADEAANESRKATVALADTTQQIKTSLNGNLEARLARLDDHGERITSLEKRFVGFEENIGEILKIVKGKDQ